ncbi:MAG: hypothetical protein IJ439_01145 [Tyzzerella sp.]|nr:hypothetical protein [Tyzzerella sp.]
MKKKLVVTSLVIALIAIAVGGTLAYFMDSDEVTNTFTIGSVEIEQIEQQRKIVADAFTSELEAFQNDKQLIPVIRNDNAKNDKNFQDKIVTVKNIGKNDAYVQTYVAVPEVLIDANVLRIYGGTQGGWATPVEVGTVEESAIVDGSTSTVKYAVFKYVYNSKLAVGATTTPVIEGVYITQEADMDVAYDANGNATSAQFMMEGKVVVGFDATQKINVYVASQAIQERGFANATTALANFKAHPWAE